MESVSCVGTAPIAPKATSNAPPLDRGAAVQESNGIMILAIGSTA